jgi:hypothetical protein
MAQAPVFGDVSALLSRACQETGDRNRLSEVGGRRPEGGTGMETDTHRRTLPSVSEKCVSLIDSVGYRG